MGWEVPVWTIKAETDAAFERQARMILEQHQICHFACASHNIRSISAVIEIARELQVPAARYEFQMLYGMAEPVRRGILRETGRVRLYCTLRRYGARHGVSGAAAAGKHLQRIIPAAEFAEDAQIDRLLEDPGVTAAQEQAGQARKPESNRSGADGLPRFTNEPMVDFTRADHRAAFPAAIARLRAQPGRTYPLFIGGTEVLTDELISSSQPGPAVGGTGSGLSGGHSRGYPCHSSRHGRISGLARYPAPRTGGIPAQGGGHSPRPDLRTVPPGRCWRSANSGTRPMPMSAEAIDFLEYYAREMIRLGAPQRLGSAPGEQNHYFYEPKGVAAVIAPWNFPLAISLGMASAAIVTGNPVVFKPSNLTGIIGCQLVEIFREAGLPAGVFNFVPGRGDVIGDFLVDHPDIALIAFTGSMEVGLRIIERAAKVHPGQTQRQEGRLRDGGQECHHHRRRCRSGRGGAAGPLFGLRLPGAEMLGLFAGDRAGCGLRPVCGASGQGGPCLSDRPGRRSGLRHGSGGRCRGAEEDSGVHIESEGTKGQLLYESPIPKDEGLLGAADDHRRHHSPNTAWPRRRSSDRCWRSCGPGISTRLSSGPIQPVLP